MIKIWEKNEESGTLAHLGTVRLATALKSMDKTACVPNLLCFTKGNFRFFSLLFDISSYCYYWENSYPCQNIYMVETLCLYLFSIKLSKLLFRSIQHCSSDTYDCEYRPQATFRFYFIYFELHADSLFKFCNFYFYHEIT